MCNTSDDRPSNCVFPERSEDEGFNGKLGSQPNCPLNPSASLLSGKTPFQGQSTEGGQGVISGQKRKAIESVGKPKGKNNESNLTRHDIHEWSGRADVDFKYDKANMAKSVKAAKKKAKKKAKYVAEAKEKVAEKSDCNHLECTQCKGSFMGESELEKHYDSEEHLAKVRPNS